MNSPSLYSQLKKAVQVLEHRKMMIPRYCDQSKNWKGTNHYSMDDIPKLQKQIDETKAAIEGIDAWRKLNRQKKVD